MSSISVSPASFQMASSETLPLAFDTTPLLVDEEAPTSPSCVLTDLSDGRAYSAGLTGSPTIAGNTITQTVTALKARHRYRLAVSFTAAAGKVWTMELEITVPF